MTNKTKVIIDRSKWRTGGDSDIATGEGNTLLLNKEGYQCCLGFICEAAGVPREKMQGWCLPGSVDMVVEGLTEYFDFGRHDACIDTKLANDAVGINDNGVMSPAEKERKLLELFKDSPYELEFVGEYSRPEAQA